MNYVIIKLIFKGEVKIREAVEDNYTYFFRLQKQMITNQES
jgi:hypothetical protein